MGDLPGHPFRGNQYTSGGYSKMKFEELTSQYRLPGEKLSDTLTRQEAAKELFAEADRQVGASGKAVYSLATSVQEKAREIHEVQQWQSVGYSEDEAKFLVLKGEKFGAGRGNPSVAELKRSGYTGGKNDAGEKDDPFEEARRAQVASGRGRAYMNEQVREHGGSKVSRGDYKTGYQKSDTAVLRQAKVMAQRARGWDSSSESDRRAMIESNLKFLKGRRK